MPAQPESRSQRQPGRCIDCPPTSKRPAARPGPRCATHARAFKKRRQRREWEQRIQRTYGITAEEYEAILSIQGNYCAICQRANGTAKRLAVDHDHKTGKVRGILCSSCNNMLGHLRDDLDAVDRMWRYLTDPPANHVLRPE